MNWTFKVFFNFVLVNFKILNILKFFSFFLLDSQFTRLLQIFLDCIKFILTDRQTDGRTNEWMDRLGFGWWLFGWVTTSTDVSHSKWLICRQSASQKTKATTSYFIWSFILWSWRKKYIFLSTSRTEKGGLRFLFFGGLKKTKV